MSIIHATIPELQSAATKLQNAMSDFGVAIGASKLAGDTVLAGWAGDAREKFSAQHQQYNAWFSEMNTIVGSYIAALGQYTTAIVEGDGASATSIGNA